MPGQTGALRVEVEVPSPVQLGIRLNENPVSPIVIPDPEKLGIK